MALLPAEIKVAQMDESNANHCADNGSLPSCIVAHNNNNNNSTELNTTLQRQVEGSVD